jgi:serine/threonine protein kinase
MNSEEEIFAAASALPAEDRAAYLDKACAGQPEMRARIEALLRSCDATGSRDRDTTVIGRGDQVGQAGESIGRYRLLQLIGEGGFGLVWMAEQVEPVSRRVALKIIKAGMDTKEVIARFEAERQALAMMDHPNIAKVLDAGATDHGRPYFVMELVKGIRITKFCDERQFTTRERLELFRDVCSAFNHAHQKGIIHRDIKPANIMVTLNGDRPVVKVIDFGIAKATQGRLTDQTLFTRFEQFIGTPAYMSPEQAAISEVDIDTRSDIYALGVLLYELLTGRPPFDTRTLVSAGYEEMRRIIREVEPPKPSTRLHTAEKERRAALARSRHVGLNELSRIVEPDLDSIVMRCLEKDRRRRYETANGLAMDVARYLNHEPVTARAQTAAYRLTKFVRRHRAAVAAAALIVISLAAAAAGASWLYFREREAHRAAEQSRLREMQMRLRFEAESLISDARFLIRNRDPEGGEKRISAVGPVVAQLVPPIAAGVHARIGDLRAQQARWQEAAGAYLRSLDCDRGSFEHWHYAIPAVLRSGAVEEYRSLRVEMMARFGATTEPRTAERLLKDCLILPWPEADPARLKQLTAVVLSGPEKHWARGYFEFAAGLAEFRTGDNDAAIAHVTESLERYSEDRNRNVQSCMVLAMARRHQGDPGAAAAAFGRGREATLRSLPAENQLFGYVGWNDWVIAHALVKEATAIIEPNP